MALHGKIKLVVVEAKGLKNMEHLQLAGLRKSDPYCLAYYGRHRLLRTRVVGSCLDPAWNTDVLVDVCGDFPELVFQIWDKNTLAADVLMGECCISREKLRASSEHPRGVEEWLDLDTKGHLHVSYKYTEAHISAISYDVPNVYFDPRHGNRITPYNCAITPKGSIPDVMTADGPVSARSYWEDLHARLNQAQKFIYITGWSVWTELKLLRDPGLEHEETLGELLIRKAEAGVTVCIMTWDEKASFDYGTIGKSATRLSFQGVLVTHDEETSKFFEGTKVHCHNIPRAVERTSYASKSGLIQDAIFTHHQKSVMLDSNGRCVAYVGGIDLCDGRWDTPDHPLFRTLRGAHEHDYHQCMVNGTTVQTGPRQPWQDIHGRLEGPIVKDVIQNFQERWQQQAEPGSCTSLIDINEEAGLSCTPLETCTPLDEGHGGCPEPADSSGGYPNPVHVPTAPGHGSGGAPPALCKYCGRLAALGLYRGKPFDTCCRECGRSRGSGGHDASCRGFPGAEVQTGPGVQLDDMCWKLKDNEAWTAQVFRSIDQSCAALRTMGASERLLNKKGLFVDKSIQTAYVHHIRRAERFLYVENQYFLGSSQCWHRPKEGCSNLVPIEIANKVCEKICLGQPFHAYINVPMWPEGIPEDKVSQEIIFWQFQTVDCMYRMVHKCLEDMGKLSHESPQDYLTFYCLVSRETKDGSQETPGENPDETASGGLMWKHRRAPIYIHSKHMVVDDEYMIMGSANINERSLSGTRDTEIAFGAYQPAHCHPGKNYLGLRGAVQAFRMQVWSAHLGIKDPHELEEFRNPHTVDVARNFQNRAKRHWEQYIGEEIVEMTGQIVPYPYHVREDTGAIEESHTCPHGHFPDTQAPICGGSMRGVPNVVTM